MSKDSIYRIIAAVAVLAILFGIYFRILNDAKERNDLKAQEEIDSYWETQEQIESAYWDGYNDGYSDGYSAGIAAK